MGWAARVSSECVRTLVLVLIIIVSIIKLRVELLELLFRTFPILLINVIILSTQ